MLELTRQDACFLLTMRGGENRFDAGFIQRFNELLDEVERDAADGGALIVTAEGKFWSNGINLEAVGASGPGLSKDFVTDLENLLGRMLILPVPTVAALNGHTFAGGAVLAMTHDYRIMREDRGWVCLPEVDIQIPFTKGMRALLARKLTPTAERDAVLLGRRFTAPEALAAGIIDATAPESELLDRAIELAAPLAGKGRTIVGQLKRGMYSDAARALGVDRPD